MSPRAAIVLMAAAVLTSLHLHVPAPEELRRRCLAVEVPACPTRFAGLSLGRHWQSGEPERSADQGLGSCRAVLKSRI
jgi:hypothetical protein